MKVFTTPEVGIIQKAVLGESLPGIDDLCHRYTKEIANAKKSNAEARIMALLVARGIFEYAALPEVQLRVQAMNVDPVTGKKREGRPKQAHRLAMEVLSKKCNITERTISRWVNDWLQVTGALKLSPDCSAEDFLGFTRQAKDLHDWFDSLPLSSNEPSEPPPEPTPEQIAKAIKTVFEKHFYTNTGNKKLAPAARQAVMRSVNPVLKEIGFELAPIGKD